MAIEAVDGGRFNCDLNPLTYDDDDHGHFSESESVVFTTTEGDEYYRCPLILASKFTRTLLRDHAFFEKNMLPYEGTIYDQPARYVEGMLLVSKIRMQVEKARQELVAKAKAMLGRR